MEFLIILALMALVVLLVAMPLRRERSAAGSEAEPADESERRDLEAARDSKLREIRDAQLDHETGKLSDEDFARVDAELRGEAVALLHALDELGPPPPD